MRVIYKYDLAVWDGITLELPRDAQILKVDQRGTELFLWALVDPDRDTEKRYFRIFGTGHPIDEGMDVVHIDTVQMFYPDGDVLIWHVFEWTTEKGR